MTAADLTGLTEAVTSSPRDATLRRILADALDDAGDAPGASRQREEARVLDLLAERRVYFERCPRGFSNEYDVFVVPTSMASRCEAALADVRRISRREALRMGISRPAEARRYGEQWFGGFYGYDVAGTQAERLDACCRASIEEIVQAEMIAEAAAEEEEDIAEWWCGAE